VIRIAVIGGGPKSLFALLALNDRLPSNSSSHVTVDIYDPLPPGAGSVWRVDQPEVLRLNVAAGIVDASSTLSAENLTAWVERVVPEMSGEKYPPRKLVGRYLQEQFLLLSQHGRARVSHVPFVVTGVERDGELWRVSGPFGAQLYDEILLATGHGLAQANIVEPVAGALNSSPLIGDYGPILKPSEIPAGSDVWIRGAALTAYDVALLLSEGRGGVWEEAKDDSDGPRPELKYCPSGEEPGRITFFSRSGSLMDPKSETVPVAVAICLDEYRRSLRKWGNEVRNTRRDAEANLDGLWVILLHCAQDCARVVGLAVSAQTLWRTALTGQSVEAEGGSMKGSIARHVSDRLQNSLAVNHLKAPVTTGWLWARVWSGLYVELVPAMDRLPRSVRASLLFGRVARNLEKFTFGPPEPTARKLVALVDAGFLHLAGADEGAPAGSILIDAVTPGPGVLRAAAPEGCPHSEVIAKLLDTGNVSIRPGDRGLLTEADGTCVAQDGSRSESLAAVGRPTEDPTLGHDTLNRSLHREHRLWAQRIAGLVTDQLNA
jgi:uncharacterized NAD(P)/FAD-binding protein YdhS